MTVLVLNDTRRGGHHGSSSVMQVLFQSLERRGLRTRSQLTDPVPLDRLAEHGVSAVVANGEGSMHGSQKSCRALAAAARQARKQGVPAHLINSVFAETDPDIIADVRQFQAIHVRESESQARLAALDIDSTVCPDLTFGIPDVPAWTNGAHVVVTDTTVDGTNAQLHAWARKQGYRFLTLRRPSETDAGRALKFNVRRHIGKAFPASYGANRYSSAITDTPAFLRTLTQGVRVVVAARFHAVCFCLKAGVPFVAVPSNTHKIQAMLADAGLAHRIIGDLETPIAPWSPADEAARVAYVGRAGRSIESMFDRLC